jgi:hypothetical protein
MRVRREKERSKNSDGIVSQAPGRPGYGMERVGFYESMSPFVIMVM